MPKHSKVLEIEITVQQFLNACSPYELKELDLLIQSPRYQNKMNCNHEVIDEVTPMVSECRNCGTLNPLKLEDDED